LEYHGYMIGRGSGASDGREGKAEAEEEDDDDVE
jgi:hypothetical protein